MTPLDEFLFSIQNENDSNDEYFKEEVEMKWKILLKHNLQYPNAQLINMPSSPENVYVYADFMKPGLLNYVVSKEDGTILPY